MLSSKTIIFLDENGENQNSLGIYFITFLGRFLGLGGHQKHPNQKDKQQNNTNQKKHKQMLTKKSKQKKHSKQNTKKQKIQKIQHTKKIQKQTPFYCQVDIMINGGGMAFTFIKEAGVGSSLYDEEGAKLVPVSWLVSFFNYFFFF